MHSGRSSRVHRSSPRRQLCVGREGKLRYWFSDDPVLSFFHFSTLSRWNRDRTRLVSIHAPSTFMRHWNILIDRCLSPRIPRKRDTTNVMPAPGSVHCTEEVGRPVGVGLWQSLNVLSWGCSTSIPALLSSSDVFPDAAQSRVNGQWFPIPPFNLKYYRHW